MPPVALLAPPLLVAVAAVLWRMAPVPYAAAIALAAVVSSIVLGWLRPDESRRSLPWLALLALLITALRMLGEAWPCEVGCSGGGHYQRLFGVEIWRLAIIAYAVLAMLAWRERLDRHWSSATAALGWGVVGCSCYFLLVSWMLGLLCPHCLAVHTAVLACTGPLLRGQGAIGPLLAWACGGLALHAAYVPLVVHDTELSLGSPTELPEGPALSPPGRLAYALADRSRRRGEPAAPYVVELAIDFQCPVCARLHGDLLAALGPALAAGRVELVTRHLVRRSEPLSPLLARWAFAAAADGSTTYQLYVAQMLGTRPGADVREARLKLAGALDPLLLEGILERHAAAIERLQADELKRLREIGATGRTPEVVLIDRASRLPVKRWQGAFAPSELATAVGE